MFKKILMLLCLFFWTVPVLAQVDTAWVRHYNGPGNWEDCARAIACDDSGNIFVTGYSTGSGTGADYATIKYYPNGDTAWLRRYNGPGGSSDYATGIAVDGSGYIYVTGYSYGDGTESDYATIKYNPNGDTVWVRRYNGPGDTRDEARVVAVDDSGNVYVTGCSTQPGSDTVYYTTIRYYPNGDTAWVRTHYEWGYLNFVNFGFDIAVDDFGNVYVAGGVEGVGTHDDYITMKYYPNGDIAWVRKYNGQVNGDDHAVALALDDSGNIYVTGYSVDSTYTHWECATIKYYPNGETAWVRTYDGSGYSGLGYAIAVSSSGNIHVAAYTWEPTTGDNWGTIKYYPNGDTAWVRTYNGSGNSGDLPSDIAVDSSGNVYVTGHTYDDETGGEFTSIRYDSSGNELWVHRYNKWESASDAAYAIALDNAGNVYATGYSEGSEGKSDYTTIKYKQNLIAHFSASPEFGVIPCTVQFTDLSAGNPDMWFWNFGDDSTSTEQHPVHTYTDTGYFDVKLVVSNDTYSDSVTKHDCIHVFPVIADFSGDPQYGVVPLDVQFTDLSEGDPTSWLWNFGDDSTSTEQHPLHTYNDTGYFDVKLVVTSAQGTDSLIKDSYIHVMLYPVCSEDPNDLGECDTMYVEPWQDDTLLNLEAGPPYFVRVPIYVTHDVPNPEEDSIIGFVVPLCYTHSNSSKYCSLTGWWNTTSLNSDSNTDHSIFRHLVRSEGDTVINRMMHLAEAGSDLEWDNVILDLDGTSHFWFATSAASEQDQGWWEGSRVLLATMTFKVEDTMQVCIDTCFWPPSGKLKWGAGINQIYTYIPRLGTPHDSASYEICFNLKLGGFIADFSADPTLGPVPLDVQFTDLSYGDPDSWFWDFGDDSTSTGQHPLHTYNDTGYFDVKLIASNAEDSDTATKPNYIYVFTPVVANFSAEPQSGLVPLEVHFTDSSEGNPTSWFWEFGDDSISTDQHPVHTYNDTGYFDVKLIASNEFDADTILKQNFIRVADRVTSDFSAEPQLGLVPLQVQFTDLSVGELTSWFWEFGDDSTSTDQHPAHTYNDTGYFDVKLVVTGETDADSITKYGYIHAMPVIADFSAQPESGFAPLEVQFTDSSEGDPTSWFWDFGDTHTDTVQNPLHTYDFPGYFDVKLVVSNEAGPDSLTKNNCIHVLPIVDDFSAEPESGFVPLQVQFTDLSEGNLTFWFWDFGDGNTDSIQNPMHTYSDTGYFDIKLIIGNAQETDSLIKEDYIHVTPRICSEDTVDHGACDTINVICLDCEIDTTVRSSNFARFALFVTHDHMDEIDSIGGFVIPITWTHTNPTAYCSLGDYWNTTSTLWDAPDFDRSIFRHIVDGADTLYHNRMADLAADYSGRDWNTCILELNTESAYMYLALAATGAEDQRWWEGNRVLLATLTFKIEDTMHVCIDTTLWPPSSHLTFFRSDAETYVPRDNLPHCFHIDILRIDGDANSDGTVDLGDVLYLINYLYKNGPPPVPLKAGDENCNGEVDLGDVLYVINYLYRGGVPPEHCEY